MRFPKSKLIEGYGKLLFDYSHLGKLQHYISNRNRRNAVFIWIPKSAGTSMFTLLSKYGCINSKSVRRVKCRFSQQGIVTFNHMDYSQLHKEGLINEKFWESAFTFCISRNPYDRAISNYEYLTSWRSERPGFLEFWESIKENGIDNIGLYNARGLSHCNPQVRWVENIRLDYIGRLENIREDTQHILEELGLPPVEMPHRNKSKRRSISDYYNPESKKIIEDLYAEDFDFFAYPRTLD